MRPTPPTRPPGTSIYRDDANKVAFALANTPPGMRPNFDLLALKMIRQGKSKSNPGDLALTMQLAWKRATRKARAEAGVE